MLSRSWPVHQHDRLKSGGDEVKRGEGMAGLRGFVCWRPPFDAHVLVTRTTESGIELAFPAKMSLESFVCGRALETNSSRLSALITAVSRGPILHAST